MTMEAHDHVYFDPHQMEKYPSQCHDESPIGSGNSRILYRRSLVKTYLPLKGVWVIGTGFFSPLDYMLQIKKKNLLS